MSLSIVGGMWSDVGKRRQSNQDTAVLGEEVFVVCDGMGGHAGGEVASLAFATALCDLTKPVRVLAAGSLTRRWPDPIRTYDLARRVMMTATKETPSAGTTCTALLGGKILHVGDSRAYRLRGGVLSLLTQDHSVTSELVRAGEITEEEAEWHPLRHTLTRCVGLKYCRPDIFDADLQPGDKLLLCSDGLHGEIGDEEIAVLLGGAGSPEQVARALVDRVLVGAANDNVTALVVQVG